MNIRLPAARPSTAAAAWLLAGIAGMPATAQPGEPEFGFTANAGYQYDSNVNLAEIDTNTGEGDSALATDLGIHGSLPVAERLTLDLAYSYAATQYRNHPEFDLAIHHLRGELGYRFAGFDSALSVDRFTVRQDSEGLVDITRVSPSLSRMIGDRLYLRGAWARSEKAYGDHAERDAVNDALRADAYILVDGLQRYLAVTLQRDDEDALSDAFDYRGLYAKLAYGHRLEAGPLKVDLKAHVAIQNRDYQRVAGADEAPRRDERLRSGLSAGLPLSEWFELTGRVEYADNNSTLAAADYGEMVYSFNIGADF